MNDQLTVGGLFSGIGGWELGLERAGMRVVWHCEQDPFCMRVLEHHWPSVPVYPDVRDLRGADVDPVDVLCGGFPCQDISVAGAGAGIDGARSGLWSEYARLVGELRPRYVLVENVSALLARGLERVLGDLASLGYDAEWDCIPASAVGAPHQRDRVWLVAYPASDGWGQGHANGRRGAKGVRSRTERGFGDDRQDVANPDSAGLERHGGSLLCAGERAVGSKGSGAGGFARYADHWFVEPAVGRVAARVPQRVDRLRSLGNALVPQISEWIGRRVLEWEGLSVR